MRRGNWTVRALGLSLLLLAASCGNPFGGEEKGSRFTPTISNISISNHAINCGRNYTVSFSFHDPQGDIDRVVQTITGETGGGLILETLDWNASERVVHVPADANATSGTATITNMFECSPSLPEDTYTVQIVVRDSRDHTSNQLTETIVLQ